MNDNTAIAIAESIGEWANATQGEKIMAWQHLIDTGLVWTLPGWFTRRAAELIRLGVCRKAGKER